MKLHSFTAALDIIGINPFVFVPEKILTALFKSAGRDKGPIPIKGTVNKIPFTQTLVKYKGYWRLYINTTMLKKSPERIGEKIKISVTVDTADRTISAHPKLVRALRQNPKAKTAFDALIPSRKKEILRYINNLKTASSLEVNITRVIAHLTGQERFARRDKP